MRWRWPGWPWIADALRTLAALPLSAAVAGLVLILWRGGWPEATAEARVQWLGLGMLALIALLGLALFFVREGIRSISVRAGPAEISVNEGSEDRQ